MNDLSLRVKALEDEIERLRTKELGYTPVTLDIPLLPINGATYSTVAVSTEITAATLGTPANAKLLAVQLIAKESASGINTWFAIGPSATYFYEVTAYTQVNNHWSPGTGPFCKTDANGSIWYQASASGVNTLTVTLRIWEYFL